MNIVFDIVLLLVFAFFVVRGIFRGFLKSVLYFGHTIIAIVLTLLFGGPISSWISSAVGGTFATVITYILLFVVFYIGTSVAIYFVGRIVELPVLKQFDKLFGTLLGIVTGWISISFLSTVLYVIIRLADHMEIYENSLIFKLATNLNFFTFLINWMI